MKKTFFTFAVSLVLVMATLFYVRLRFLLVELSYKVSEKRTEKVQLEQAKRALTLELATLKNPERIERLANRELGLGRKSSSFTVLLAPERSAR